MQTRSRNKRRSPQSPAQPREIAQAHEALGAKIRRLRRKKGLSQEEFAAQCGLSPRQMEKIEEGSNYQIPFSMLWRLALRLEMSMTDLFSGIDKRQAT